MLHSEQRVVMSLGGMVWSLILLAGCAGAGGNESVYRDITRPAGEGSLYDINTKTSRILNRNNYETIRNEQTDHLIFFETNWRYRTPFTDELSQGVVEAQTRLTVRARPRRAATVAGASNLYIVKLVAENRVLFAGNATWVTIPNTGEYRAYIAKMAKDLENELRMAIRKF